MDNTEKILAYLENDLTSEERLNFENELKGDNNLQRELKFQEEVISGIKAVRKAELKAMLNAVPVTGGANISSGQYISGIMAAIIISAGLFYFWPSEEINVASGPVIEFNKELEDGIQTTEENKKENEPLVNTQEDYKTPNVESKKEESKTEIKVKSSQETVTENEVPNDATISTPSIPQITNVDADVDEVTNPQNDLITTSATETESLQISVISDDKYDFHYLFKNSKLFLYGKFNDTYEILDFNKEGNRALYLFTNAKFYPLDVNAKKVTALTPVKDKTLIAELDKMRNKSN